jgi:glycerophosphoryl diester phosphodiesterase
LLENSGTNSQDSPLIIAHRGASALAPENTLAAFERAFNDSADGVELDVRLARDGVPVVIHDPTLRRTGCRAGVVSEMTSAELGTIDVGSWFHRSHPKLARADYKDQTIPMLADVFSLATLERARHGKEREAVIYVEMKSETAAEGEGELARSVSRLITQSNLQSRVVVVSFNLKAIAAVKALDASIRTGALFEPKRSAAKSISGRRLIAAAIECGADEILLHKLIAPRRVIDMATAKGLCSVVWTVDDAKWLSRATRRGIHALITNNPAAMMLEYQPQLGLNPFD